MKRILSHHGNGTKLGNYRLLKKIGDGGMGTVFLAEDTAVQRQVALKILKPSRECDAEFIARFHREAKALGRLNHENIIAAFSFGEDLGHHYYVMEYCDGSPLDAILKREKRLCFNRALEIIIPVTRGLLHAHKHGVIHRDIKPANIVISSDGIPKILDLGLSKNIIEGDSFHTQSGAALGTPHYISPEQVRGDRNVDARSDIYSLGATLFHLVTGRPPFSGQGAMAIMAKHLTAALPNPRSIQPDLCDSAVKLIQRMMAKAPDQRYRDCEELLDDLERAQNGEPLSGSGSGHRRRVQQLCGY